MKLVQKQLFKGSRTFEIDGDTLNVHIKAPLSQEKLSVVLAIVNPEPVVNAPFLEFHSRVKCGPLIELLLDKPDKDAFDRFVALLQQRIREEYSAFTGLRNGSLPQGIAANSYEEPPDFDAPKKPSEGKKSINADGIDDSIRMLHQHLGDDDLGELFGALEALGADPQNESHSAALVDAFEKLGPRQGAVLTYAPYLSILLSDDPFER